MFSSSSLVVSEILEAIPENDREDLNRFFLLLAKSETIAYTLFGQKPISVGNFLKFTYDYPHSIFCLIFEKGWEAWLRNKYLFPQDKFFFRREDNRVASFYLINKKYTLEKIYENLDLFRQNLGEISAKEVLDRLCSDEPIQNLLSTQYLWGVFFGYGKKNSECFAKECESLETLSGKLFLPIPSRKSISSLNPESRKMLERLISKGRYILPKENSVPFSEYVSKLNELMSQRKSFELTGSPILLTRYQPPAFAYWDERETAELQDAYGKTRSNMRKTYGDQSFLESVINQWVSLR